MNERNSAVSALESLPSPISVRLEGLVLRELSGVQCKRRLEALFPAYPSFPVPVAIYEDFIDKHGDHLREERWQAHVRAGSDAYQHLMSMVESKWDADDRYPDSIAKFIQVCQEEFAKPGNGHAERAHTTCISKLLSELETELDCMDDPMTRVSWWDEPLLESEMEEMSSRLFSALFGDVFIESLLFSEKVPDPREGPSGN